MASSKPSAALSSQRDERLRLLMKEIHAEEVPERMLELARKLQIALDERDSDKPKH
ncbi:hypothetical protein PZ897_14465 [Hoeflea sp. YIM 152468]|uniref:hypothetical protein n=1 Tax=Hoeflea sp. YIM 152468 TaxID=3031759 RepID=UPI0023DB5BED|nr:hypothetical protein [Hoeflea sp. YIM 152468]MDF1609385.1 hypothetical protein [Hoeflea sp. YIM 152468]